MLMTLTCGYVQMHYPLGMTTSSSTTGLHGNVRPSKFRRHMLLVGTMRWVNRCF